MKKLLLVLAACCISFTTVYAGTVEVSPAFQGTSRLDTVIAPSQYKILPIGSLTAGDALAIDVAISNKVYNDITACIVSEVDLASYQSGGACRGFIKARTPLKLQGRAQSTGMYYLILDNGYAAFITKTASVQVTTNRRLTPVDVQRLSSVFESVRSQMDRTFDKADFNIFVKPCGMSNAFSENSSADITMCTELIHELLQQGDLGSLFAVLFHEYGHSLLNKWGEPGASEEDMADQFATAMLLRGGDNGRRMLQSWIGFWLKKDSRQEAEIQLSRNMTHSLSIQRARNIQRYLNTPEDMTRRWNKVLYRNMTRWGLEQAITKPTKADDVDLATEALQSRFP